MPAPKPPAFETLSLHAGQRPDPLTGARAVPIYQTTSYVFQDADHAAALFNLERAGHIYTRISNPTTAVLEERIAALECGVGAICTASGMAAMHLAIATLLNAGDHIVASASLYGGTINLLAHTLPRFGITTTFVKPRALDEFRAAIRPNSSRVTVHMAMVTRRRVANSTRPPRMLAAAPSLAGEAPWSWPGAVIACSRPCLPAWPTLRPSSPLPSDRRSPALRCRRAGRPCRR